ncbi:hypothetical protein FSP39_009247 [Pinctada imbricata]|uniref:Uncharacterized protein n=1 Tax=Pinctada imbricata TaxID=66713 RepID=A0AA89BNY2_PINIB|nr:hypothetical protein FSP39_009247 [Pinctada imbricata]
MATAEKSTRGRKSSFTDSARKRRRKEVTSNWNKNRINIGEQMERWKDLKDRLNLDSNRDVAEFLLDRDSMSDISGVEAISHATPLKLEKEMNKSTSFVNPMLACEDIPIEGGSESEWEDDADDDEMDRSAEPLPTIHRVTIDNIDGLINDRCYMTYHHSILSLAKINIPSNCTIKGCSSQVAITSEEKASALYLKWTCSSGHILHKWCSQPMLNNRMHAGDLLLSSSILLSGNNFKKAEMMFKFMNMPIVSPSSFYKMQRTYLVPSIDEYWLEQQKIVLDEFRNKDIVVLGDGRMDSPGHSAQFCSYTFMENDTKKILCIITMDKRLTGRKSTNLEKACFLEGMKYLRDEGIRVVEVVTDAHVQISALMKREFPNIKHSFDVWHGTKNLGKKIMAQGQERSKSQLLTWSKDIVNHFWYCAEKALTTEEFLGMWYGVLHHVVDEHEWVLPYCSAISNRCHHGDLIRDANEVKEWLKKGSAPHEALRHIVMDKRLVNQVHHYINFRSTAELENFQNLILMYASKRNSFRPPVYRVRNRLAGLDYNAHVDRAVKINKDGKIRYQRTFNKKSARWSVYAVKVDKTYKHICGLMKKIVSKRLVDKTGMNRKVVLASDDPRRISSVIAPIPPPPTSQLVQEQKSRFKSN